MTVFTLLRQTAGVSRGERSMSGSYREIIGLFSVVGILDVIH